MPSLLALSNIYSYVFISSHHTVLINHHVLSAQAQLIFVCSILLWYLNLTVLASHSPSPSMDVVIGISSLRSLKWSYSIHTKHKSTKWHRREAGLCLIPLVIIRLLLQQSHRTREQALETEGGRSNDE